MGALFQFDIERAAAGLAQNLDLSAIEVAGIVGRQRHFGRTVGVLAQAGDAERPGSPR